MPCTNCQMVKHAIINIPKIIEAWSYRGDLPEYSLRRLEICKGSKQIAPCPHFITEKYEKCGLCKCPISKLIIPKDLKNLCLLDKWKL